MGTHWHLAVTPGLWSGHPQGGLFPDLHGCLGLRSPQPENLGSDLYGHILPQPRFLPSVSLPGTLCLTQLQDKSNLLLWEVRLNVKRESGSSFMLLLENAALSPGRHVPFGCIADLSHSGPIYFFPIPLPHSFLELSVFLVPRAAHTFLLLQYSDSPVQHANQTLGWISSC